MNVIVFVTIASACTDLRSNVFVALRCVAPASTHLNTEHAATPSLCRCSVLNILMGVGLLSVPYALSKSGYAGVAILLLLAVVTNYSGKALVRCANTVAARGEVEAGAMVRYEDIARTAFGNFGKTIIAAIMYTELVGTCALLLILESDSLWSVAGPTLKEQGASALGGLGSWIATQRGVFWLAMAIVVPTVCAPNVASLSFLGVCGFAATATVTATVATLLFSGVPTPLLFRSCL